MKAIGLTFILGFGLTEGAIAQVIPDSTVGTTVSPTNLITGGTRTGNNLFHSFTQFSIPTNGSAIFNNPTDIQNIFSRVTGTTRSSIDGLIQAQGNANLFLMNPNGILFGPNAKLDIGGSFIGTTANSIKFADGVQFSSSDVTPNPLLTVSLPIGLQMGQNPGTIQLNNTGHQLAAASPTLMPYFPTGPITGLTVQPGNTIALVGGEINLVGGILTAPQGRIELGSVGAGQLVQLDTQKPIFKLDYSATDQFGNISLSQRSIADVSGSGAGSIQVQGQRIRLIEGSLLFNQNRGMQPAGDITVRADSLEVLGGIAATNIRSAIVSETIAGDTGHLFINTQQLRLMEGGSLVTRSFGVGTSGNIQINVSRSTQIYGFLAANPELYSVIGTVSFSPLTTGRSGKLNITTSSLSLRDGGAISATTFGNASAGSVNINAGQIEIMGQRPALLGVSVIASASFGQGNAGDINVNASTLSLQGSIISTASFGGGNAGNIVIHATHSIALTNDTLGPSSIDSSVNSGIPGNQQISGLTNQFLGTAGSINISTSSLQVLNRSFIAVSNSGLGNSGKLSIVADQVRLDHQALLGATTALGEGGDIALKAESLILRHGSNIATTAGGLGNGGNIIVNASVITGFENSDIIANAIKGRGGNIQITTQGLFGLKFRPQLTPESDITASSDFGINGTVQINSFGLDPSSSLVKLNGEVIDPSRSIAKGCAGVQGNRFIITGRGGIPRSPLKKTMTDRSWNDLRGTTKPTPIVAIQHPAFKLIEATRIQTYLDGTIALIDGNSVSLGNRATCAIAL